MTMLNEYEELAWAKGATVMGIDEAGRGPLCGPLVVACCVLPIGYQNEEINDSKKLSAKKRERLFKQIVTDAEYFRFVIVPPSHIDEVNIYAATKEAMASLSAGYSSTLYTLTDAMPLEEEKVISMIKGDAKSISIAAASILAKVLRDHIMKGYDILFPEYEYTSHMGYPTKKHIEKMEQYGVTSIYRFSYRPCQGKKMRKDDPFRK